MNFDIASDNKETYLIIICKIETSIIFLLFTNCVLYKNGVSLIFFTPVPEDGI